MTQYGYQGQKTARSGHGADRHDDEGLDLLHLLATLWHGKWFIAICTVLAMLIGGYYAFRVAVPRYSATANLALQLRRQLVQEVDSVTSAIPPEFSAMFTELGSGLITKT